MSNYISKITVDGVTALLKDQESRDILTPLNLKVANYPFINVRDYGAVGNGTTDDTNALQSAFNVGANKVILFESGKKYKISNYLKVPSNCIIFGNNSTLSYSTDHDVSLCLMNPSTENSTGYSGVHDVIIRDLILDGNNKTIVAPYWYGLLTMAHCKNVVIENVTFKNINNGHAIELNSSNNVSIRNCTFANISYGGDDVTRAAINIDGAASGSIYGLASASYDRTMCNLVMIAGCTFSDVASPFDAHTAILNAAGNGFNFHEQVKINNCIVSRCKAITTINCIRRLSVTNMIVNGVTSSSIAPIRLYGVQASEFKDIIISDINFTADNVYVVSVGAAELSGIKRQTYNIVLSGFDMSLLSGSKYAKLCYINETNGAFIRDMTSTANFDRLVSCSGSGTNIYFSDIYMKILANVAYASASGARLFVTNSTFTNNTQLSECASGATIRFKDVYANNLTLSGSGSSRADNCNTI